MSRTEIDTAHAASDPAVSFVFSFLPSRIRMCFEVLGLSNIITQMDMTHTSADPAKDVITDVSIDPEMLE